MERSFHTLLAAASGGNFDVDITPGATIIPDSDYNTVAFHMNLIKLLSRVDAGRASKNYVGNQLGARVGSSSIYWPDREIESPTTMRWLTDIRTPARTWRIYELFAG